MAEALGILAGIAQLTGQVAQGIIRLKAYWDQMKDAPAEMISLIRDLEFINSILSDFEKEYAHKRLPDTAFDNNLLHQSLVICREGAKELHDLVQSLNSQSSTRGTFRKHRAALSVVYKQDQLKRYKTKLKRATHMLSLAHQSYTRTLLQLQLDSLSSTLPATSLQVKSTTEIVAQKDASGPDKTQYVNPLTLSRTMISPLFLVILHIALRESTYLNLAAILLITCFYALLVDTKVPNQLHIFAQSIRRDPSRLLDWMTAPERDLEMAILGSVKLSKEQRRKRRTFAQQVNWGVQSHVIARYHAPKWSSYKTWEFRWYRADLGWTCHLAVYNVISSKSKQFLYARHGSLSKLQQMLVTKRAFLSDQTEDGDTILSIAAKNGHIELCRWLLHNGARADRSRFGSVLKQVLHYGGWMSFHKGAAMFEIVRLLHQYEEEDIFDRYDNDIDTRCFFYGRKEILVWLLTKSSEYTDTEMQIQLAINLARNIDHNAPELVRATLESVDLTIALRINNLNNINLLHRIASRLGGGFAYERLRIERFTRYLDEGFEAPEDYAEKEILARKGWRSFLRTLDLRKTDLHTVSNLNLTPLLTGFRTLNVLWAGTSSGMVRALCEFLEVWLLDLQNTGVDILQYGIEEKRLCNSGLVCKTFYRHQRKAEPGGLTTTANAQNVSYGALRLISIEPSSFPSKWQLWWSEPTDEFAGEFWKMFERSPTTPGAWDLNCVT